MHINTGVQLQALSHGRRPDDLRRRVGLRRQDGGGGRRRGAVGQPLPQRLLQPRHLRLHDRDLHLLHGLLLLELRAHERAGPLSAPHDKN